MHRIILSSVAWPALSHFFLHYLVNDMIFDKKKVIEAKMYILISSTIFFFPGTFLILRRTERGMIINAYWFPSKVSAVLVRL